MKKAFCFNFCACHVLRTNLSTSDLRFVQVTSVEKREPRGTFLSLGLRPRLQKTFPRFPFFYFGNLDKPQIRRGQICPQTWQAQKSKQNTKEFVFLLQSLILNFFLQSKRKKKTRSKHSRSGSKASLKEFFSESATSSTPVPSNVNNRFKIKIKQIYLRIRALFNIKKLSKTSLYS